MLLLVGLQGDGVVCHSSVVDEYTGVSCRIHLPHCNVMHSLAVAVVNLEFCPVMGQAGREAQFIEI